jgi:DNA mismatch repair ATPase MutS
MIRLTAPGVSLLASLLDALPGGPTALVPVAFLAAVVIFAIYQLLKPRSERGRREKLRAAWGKAEITRRRDVAAISSLHEAMREVPAALELTEDTAADLDLEQVFVALDRTLTEPGQQALHRLLRRPLFEPQTLQERGRALRLLQENAAVREELQLALMPLGEAAPGTLVPLLTPARPLALPLPAFAYSMLAVSALASLGLWAIVGAPGLLAVAAAYVVNAAMHYTAERVVTSALPGILSLQRLIAAAQRLSRSKLPGLEENQKRLLVELQSIAALSKALAGVSLPAAADDLAVYVNLFVLRQVRLLARAAPLLSEHRAQLLALIEEVGMLDALQSIASFRQEKAGWCEPQLSDEAVAIDARELRHPLLSEAVPNSILLQGGALITGSNMAGKSTFLRTVGINSLLAQTIFTCFATRWSGPPLRLATSLRRSDSLLAGRSYYLAEAQGILKAIRSTELPPKTLCILDEIFRGTNTAERVAASAEVLRWLAARGALVLAATHDDALTTMLEGTYRNFHFGETIEETGMVFDYLLKEGPATTRNAIELLRILGYPEELVAAAKANAPAR